MPALIVQGPDGTKRMAPLVKRITTVGRGVDNDVQLEDPALAESALHLLFDGSSHTLESHGGDVRVNGKVKSSHRLGEGDIVELGSWTLIYSSGQASVPATPFTAVQAAGSGPGADGDPGLAALRRLTAFSEALVTETHLDRILERLMDEIVDLTRADKGLLILVEDRNLRVKVARNVAKANLDGGGEGVSDSIVAKVVETRRPLIVSDALADPQFKSSESVVNLRLLSVMCVPLMHRGELFGVIYVGNDRLTHRFEQKSLDLLTIFAAQASLLVQNALLVNELRLDNTELKRKLEEQH